MSEFPDEDAVEGRAHHLLPEEESAGGSDDPELQAKVILEDSENRTQEPELGAETSKQTATR